MRDQVVAPPRFLLFVRNLLMVTLRLTVEQFQQLLSVMLAASTPNQLSDLVLLKCTRPHEGIISIPVPLDDATAIAAGVSDESNRDASMVDLASLIHQQLIDAH